MLEFTELEQQLIDKLDDAGVAEEVASEWLGDIITARVQQAAEESLTGALHPEFGTEWREPNGIIWKAIQQVEAERDEARSRALSYLRQKDDERERANGNWRALEEWSKRAEAAEARYAALVAKVEALAIHGDSACTYPDDACVCAVNIFDLRAALSDAGRGK